MRARAREVIFALRDSRVAHGTLVSRIKTPRAKLRKDRYVITFVECNDNLPPFIAGSSFANDGNRLCVYLLRINQKKKKNGEILIFSARDNRPEGNRATDYFVISAIKPGDHVCLLPNALSRERDSSIPR